MKKMTRDMQRRNSKTEINSSTSIITLNKNGINTQMERKRLSNQITKQCPALCCLQLTHFRFKNTNWLKVKQKDITCKQ